MLKQVYRFIGMVGLCVLLTGCQNESEVVYVEVKLTVLLNDQPLADANVMLVPRKLHDSIGKVTPFSMGTTDQKGECVLLPMAHEDNPNYGFGISPGTYSVIISKPLSTNNADQKVFLPQAINAPGEWELFSGSSNEVPACYHSSDSLTLEIPETPKFEHRYELQSRCP